MKSFYEILNIDEAELGQHQQQNDETLKSEKNKIEQVIKEAYFAALRLHHPDKQQQQQRQTGERQEETAEGGSAAEHRVSLIKRAYTVLKDPQTRLTYDQWLTEQRLRSAALVYDSVDLAGFEVDDWTIDCRCGGVYLLEDPQSSLTQIVDKILVIGEAGVGKTTFVNSLCGIPVKDPPWTVGCSVEVMIHHFRAGTQYETPYFIELWDIGGSRSHRSARKVFYPNAHGVILVYDLTNRKSEENLEGWLKEVMAGSSKGLDSVVSSVPSPISSTPYGSPDHASNLLNAANLPVLIVGSKAEQEGGTPSLSYAKKFSGEELPMDCRKPMSPGSTNSLKMSRYLDRVIENNIRKASSGTANNHLTANYGSRRLPTNMSTKLF